jgi:hypothetical protein
MRFWFHAILNGIILIGVGLAIWLSNLGVFHIVWRRDWPVILVAVGMINLVKYFVWRR